jgi:hypothetical protein
MKIEHNFLNFSASGAKTGYIDLARALSAVNAKSITQTIRKDGKYKPLTYMIRIRALTGTGTFQYLPSSYPIRNSVVLAGAARDAMLDSAGISRSNLETYQKELRIKLEAGNTDTNQFFPYALSMGTSYGGFGETLTYDYTKLTMARPDEAADSITLPLNMLGEQNANEDSWDSDSGWYVIDNWRKFRKEFTEQSSSDDSENNIFSWVMQQGSTAGDILDRLDDEQDEKPYNLFEFRSQMCGTIISTAVGSPTSPILSVPLGLLKLTTDATAGFEIEVVGVAEL